MYLDIHPWKDLLHNGITVCGAVSTMLLCWDAGYLPFCACIVVGNATTQLNVVFQI